MPNLEFPQSVIISQADHPVQMGFVVRIWHRVSARYGKGFGQKKSTHREISDGNRLGFLEKHDFRTENIGMC
jgi:hypothetical protein